MPRASNPVHPSFIVQVDGLLHAVFRLRLERDVCGTSVSSYCPMFGAGLSAASTFCGLFLPWPSPLSAIITAVKAERGYGVFAGPTPSVHAVGGHILLEFSFPSYSGDAWRAVLVSFAFRGKVRRKRPETFFSLSLICPSPEAVGLLPFCWPCFPGSQLRFLALIHPLLLRHYRCSLGLSLSLHLLRDGAKLSCGSALLIFRVRFYPTSRSPLLLQTELPPDSVVIAPSVCCHPTCPLVLRSSLRFALILSRR